MENFNHYLQLKKQSPATRTTTIKTITRFTIWCKQHNLQPAEASYTEVMDYIAQLRKKGNTPRTQQIIINQLSNWFKYLIATNQRADNPATNIQVKDVKRRTLYKTFTTEELADIYNTFVTPSDSRGELTQATGQRNKIILGLIVYQGLRSEELAALEVKDVRLREGKIQINAQRKTAERELKLEPYQLFDLQDYLLISRPKLLAATGKQTDKLFISAGRGEGLQNTISLLKKELQEKNPNIKNIEHLRCSVITNWLKNHNLRKVQYMAGHRYVSSTEAYKANDQTILQEEIKKFHPLG